MMEQFGLAANGHGTADAMSTYAVIGKGHGPGMFMHAAHGNIPVVAIDGIGGTGINIVAGFKWQ